MINMQNYGPKVISPRIFELIFNLKIKESITGSSSRKTIFLISVNILDKNRQSFQFASWSIQVFDVLQGQSPFVFYSKEKSIYSAKMSQSGNAFGANAP